MPEQYERVDRDWPRRRALWREHYRAKGCNDRKAEQCADRKRTKQTTP